MNAIINLSRRRFLKAGITAGGGLLLFMFLSLDGLPQPPPPRGRQPHSIPGCALPQTAP